jgi:transcriptional regulator with XRE-family HTH domain
MTKQVEADSFGGLARVQIKRLGWTQQQFAERLGVKQSVISYFLTGRNQPTFDTIMRWARTLGCSPRDLVPAHVPALYGDVIHHADKEMSDISSHPSSHPLSHLSSDSVEI